MVVLGINGTAGTRADSPEFRLGFARWSGRTEIRTTNGTKVPVPVQRVILFARCHRCNWTDTIGPPQFSSCLNRRRVALDKLVQLDRNVSWLLRPCIRQPSMLLESDPSTVLPSTGPLHQEPLCRPLHDLEERDHPSLTSASWLAPTFAWPPCSSRRTACPLALRGPPNHCSAGTQRLGFEHWTVGLPESLSSETLCYCQAVALACLWPLTWTVWIGWPSAQALIPRCQSSIACRMPAM